MSFIDQYKFPEGEGSYKIISHNYYYLHSCFPKNPTCLSLQLYTSPAAAFECESVLAKCFETKDLDHFSKQIPPTR